MTVPVPATDDTFAALLPHAGVAVVDFWAPGCAPCTAFEPIFAASAASRPEIVHLTVNAAENPVLSDRFEIQAIPTTVFLRDGAVTLELSGGVSAGDLADLIDHVAGLDDADAVDA